MPPFDYVGVNSMSDYCDRYRHQWGRASTGRCASRLWRHRLLPCIHVHKHCNPILLALRHVKSWRWPSFFSNHLADRGSLLLHIGMHPLRFRMVDCSPVDRAPDPIPLWSGGHQGSSYIQGSRGTLSPFWVNLWVAWQWPQTPWWRVFDTPTLPRYFRVAWLFSILEAMPPIPFSSSDWCGSFHLWQWFLNSRWSSVQICIWWVSGKMILFPKDPILRTLSFNGTLDLPLLQPGCHPYIWTVLLGICSLNDRRCGPYISGMWLVNSWDWKTSHWVDIVQRVF